MRLIDAHIHLDMYEEDEQEQIITDLDSENIEALITVSNHFKSAQENLRLKERDARIKVAVGYHPEQALPSEKETRTIIDLAKERAKDIIAIGEVGLPYYLRKENPHIKRDAYVDLLEQFIVLAKELNKPIVLHSIYEDATITSDLLEKHDIKKAHFHWFKGEDKILERIIANGHVISVTPDVCYEKDIQHIVKATPLNQILLETDGPWPFENQFERQMTHPKMMHESVKVIAKLKGITEEDVYKQTIHSTKDFYYV